MQLPQRSVFCEPGILLRGGRGTARVSSAATAGSHEHLEEFVNPAVRGSLVPVRHACMHQIIMQAWSLDTWLLRRGNRRLPAGSPLAGHLAPGDALVAVNGCPVAGAADWRACLGAGAAAAGAGQAYCVPDALVQPALRCAAAAAAADADGCAVDELCWTPAERARPGLSFCSVVTAACATTMCTHGAGVPVTLQLFGTTQDRGPVRPPYSCKHMRRAGGALECWRTPVSGFAAGGAGSAAAEGAADKEARRPGEALASEPGYCLQARASPAPVSPASPVASLCMSLPQRGPRLSSPGRLTAPAPCGLGRLAQQQEWPAGPTESSPERGAACALSAGLLTRLIQRLRACMSGRAHAQALSAAARPPSRADECGNGTMGLRPRLPAGEQLWRVCYARAGGPAGGPAAPRARQPAHSGGAAAGPGPARNCRASLVFAGSAAALAADVQARARGAGCLAAAPGCTPTPTLPYHTPTSTLAA